MTNTPHPSDADGVAIADGGTPMNFDLTDELRRVRDEARAFADNEVAPHASRLERNDEYPREIIAKAAERGYLGMLIPKEFGGRELGNMALTLLLVELNRACASTGVTVSVHNSLATAPLIKFGTDDQKQRYLPKLASGEMLGAYALTEPHCGSDAAALSCFAEKDGDHYVLNGVKSWITQGNEADFMVVYARTDKESKTKGITCFLVETATPGFSAAKKEDKLGIRASPTVEVSFDNCRVPAANVLGEVNKGFPIAMNTLDGGRIGIASQSLGIAEACLNAAVAYAKEHTRGGRPLAKSQAVQQSLAEMATRIDAARFLTYRASITRDRGETHTIEASKAKLYASRTANYCAQEAMQIFGGDGYLRDHAMERYYRDARITEIYEGTTEIQRLVIARSLLA